MKDAAVFVSDVSFSYGSLSILSAVNLVAKSGEYIGIIGPNGGGKTTLLKLLMGFLLPDKGVILIEGKTVEKGRLAIGYVPQSHRFDREFPITVFELVLLGALNRLPFLGTIPTWIRNKAGALIQRLGLEPHRNKAFGSLSGGLAQRALLARALLSDPAILLLDEPTANIDPPSAALIFEILEEMRGKKTILLITHDIKTVLEKVDKVYCIEGAAHLFRPGEVCEHFAFGLYHTPLLGLPKNHFERKN